MAKSYSLEFFSITLETLCQNNLAFWALLYFFLRIPKEYFNLEDNILKSKPLNEIFSASFIFNAANSVYFNGFKILTSLGTNSSNPPPWPNSIKSTEYLE